jgi:hypothetical protein
MCIWLLRELYKNAKSKRFPRVGKEYQNLIEPGLLSTPHNWVVFVTPGPPHKIKIRFI